MYNSKKRSIWIAYLYIFLLLGCTFQRPVFSAEAPKPAITNIRAHLFYSSNGEFSPNVLKGTDFVLWNTVIGGGSAKAWSNETLVVVEVSAQPDAIHNEYVLKFKATYPYGGVDAKGKPDNHEIIVKGQRDASTFDKTGKMYFGFWLNDTGCNLVEIRASISPVNSVVEVDIPFHCGE